MKTGRSGDLQELCLAREWRGLARAVVFLLAKDFDNDILVCNKLVLLVPILADNPVGTQKWKVGLQDRC